MNNSVFVDKLTAYLSRRPVIRVHVCQVTLEVYDEVDSARDRKFGEFDPVRARIRVSVLPCSDTAQPLETLVHELMHALMFAYGVDVSVIPADRVEETVVMMLAPAWVALMTDNRELAALLEVGYAELAQGFEEASHWHTLTPVQRVGLPGAYRNSGGGS